MATECSFCHVFLSFKGETRDNFTCFLYDALEAEGFKTFMDKKTIRIGDELDSRIREGIRGSMSAIVIFSKEYAFSPWCLDELLLILERKRTSRYFIIPLFYEVKPADIKHQLGNYGAALEKHKVRHKDKVKKWREALAQVGNILGEHVEGTRNIFIQNMVKQFRENFSANFPECHLPLLKNSIPQEKNQADSYNELETGRVPYKTLIFVQKQHHVPTTHNSRYLELEVADANSQIQENFDRDIAAMVQCSRTFLPCQTPCQPPCTPCQPPCMPCQPPCEPPCTPCEGPCMPCQSACTDISASKATD